MKPSALALLAVLLFGLATIGHAQAPDTVWTRTFGGASNDAGRSICFAIDDGYVVAGYTESFGDHPQDAYIFKVDVSGNLVWEHNHGTEGFYYARCIRPTSDRGYIITGQAEEDGVFGNVFAMKTDSLGNEIWRRGYDGMIGVSVIENVDSNYVIVGGSIGYLADCLMFCIDPNGDLLWSRSYDIDFNEYINGIVQIADGGYVVTGCTGAGNGESWDLFIMKTDKYGEMLWLKDYGLPDIECDDVGYSIRQTIDEGFIVGASTASFGEGYSDFWLVKTDSSGDTLWTRTFGGWLVDFGYSALQTQDSGYVIAGTGGSFGGGPDVYVVKTDAYGDTLWTKVIGRNGSDIGTQIIETKSGGFVIVGDTYYHSHGAKDAYVIKLAAEPTGSAESDFDIYPTGFILNQNQPNPFNAQTAIEYGLPEASNVTINIYDILGRRVETLVQEEQPAGYHQVVWDAKDISSGIYFYELYVDEYRESKAMIMIK